MKRALTPEEATKLLATCNERTPIDLRDRALIVIGLETGMLCMSLVAMRLEAIGHYGLEHPVVPVPVRGSKELYSVPLSDTAIAALAPWRAWLRGQKITQGPVFCPLARRVARGGKLVYEPDLVRQTAPSAAIVIAAATLVTPETQQPMSRIAIYKAVARRAKRARLRPISPLLFRGTFIAWRMDAGLRPYEIASITGQEIANLSGMSSFSGLVDTMAVAAEARKATPAWLAKLVRS